MNPLKKAYCRIFQNVFKFALPVLPYRNPKIIGSVKGIPEVLEKRGYNNVLIITDAGIRKLGLTERLEKTLKRNCIAYQIYDKTVANPTTVNVDEALHMYLDNDCQAIIGFGGGSAMDCAKAVGARIAQPNKPVNKMRGLLRVHRRLPLLIAIPTTAGTGSEVTLAAVITDSATHHKYPINDFVLIPRYAVHDPRLTIGLPPAITAQTGMDALTHAVEAYIGRSTNAYTRAAAVEAVRLIHDNLYQAYLHGDDEDARRNMLTAAYSAGVAFTRSYVGYVHGIAHSLGGLYGTPHGLANAVILPHVLRAYGPAAHAKLAELARVCGFEGASDAELAGAFIDWVDEMNAKMGIPAHLDCIREEDIRTMAAHADAESNPLYPVPVLWDAAELACLYRLVAGSATMGAHFSPALS